jgi:hypothetical protein
MLSHSELSKKVFDAACVAIKEEDQFLRGHCERACGYHHGIGSVSEPILMYQIFRKLVADGQRSYEVRLEQRYQNDPRCQADLVLLQGDKWIVCVEGKWLESNAKVGLAKDDVDRMRRLGGDVTKLLLCFWVKDPRCKINVDRWLKELTQATGTETPRTSNFTTKWFIETGKNTLRDVDAGVTLFEVTDL